MLAEKSIRVNGRLIYKPGVHVWRLSSMYCALWGWVRWELLFNPGIKKGVLQPWVPFSIAGRNVLGPVAGNGQTKDE